MKRTRVKICGITRPSDAQEAVAAGADALGLVFYSASPRHVEIEQARAIARVVPAFVSLVGLFVDPEPDYVEAVCAQVPLDLLQFHGDETNGFCKGFGRRFMKALHMKPGLDLHDSVSAYPDACGILLDTYIAGTPGGTGETFDWRLIPSDIARPLILAGGLTPDNVAQAISLSRPYGVDVSGGVEASKGIKDGPKLQNFLREVRRGDSI